MTTTDGQEYLDCVSGIATCALGHSNPALNAAVTKQMETMHHVSNLYFIPAQAALANWLCENSNAEKVFFCNSGAEANEAAIKLARRHASNRGITVSTKNVSTQWRKRFLLLTVKLCTTFFIRDDPRFRFDLRNPSLSLLNSHSTAAPWRRHRRWRR